MSPYARRMAAAGITAAAIAATGYATHPGAADARTPAQIAPGAADARTPAQIAPGGNIASVERVTAAQGWPHAPTSAEARDVTDLALWYAQTIRNRGERVAVVCRFGWTMARAVCGIEYRAGRRRTAFRVDVKIWEDGSYRFTTRNR